MSDNTAENDTVSGLASNQVEEIILSTVFWIIGYCYQSYFLRITGNKMTSERT